MELKDHLSPPPTYSRARELSQSDESFFPPDLELRIDLEPGSEEENEEREEWTAASR